MKSHYTRSYPESKHLREQLWLQNTERLEIRALHSGLGLNTVKKLNDKAQEPIQPSLDQVKLPSFTEEMLQHREGYASVQTDPGLSSLIASMRPAQDAVISTISRNKNETNSLSLPSLPSEMLVSEKFTPYFFSLKKLLLLHLADFILVVSIFSLCFMMAIISYKIFQPSAAMGDLSKWEPIKFLLERSWYEIVLTFYGVFLVYWLTFKALRISTFGGFLVNDINQKRKVPSLV